MDLPGQGVQLGQGGHSMGPVLCQPQEVLCKAPLELSPTIISEMMTSLIHMCDGSDPHAHRNKYSTHMRPHRVPEVLCKAPLELSPTITFEMMTLLIHMCDDSNPHANRNYYSTRMRPHEVPESEPSPHVTAQIDYRT